MYFFARKHESHRLNLFLVAMALSLNGCLNGSDDDLPAAKIQAVLAPANLELPATLKDTYLFEGGDITKPQFGVIGYEVKVPLWSDGSAKTRYIFVPPASKIKFSEATGQFEYPLGTTLIKHFASSVDPKIPVETRIITLKSDSQWYYATYVWKADGTTEKNKIPQRVAAADGIEYRVPSEAECKMCHATEVGANNPVLGFVLPQLAHSVGQTEKKQDQLLHLQSKSLFDTPLPETSKVKAFDNPTDKSLSFDQRARSYLAVNCSPCHRPVGGAKEMKLDLRLQTSFAETGLITEGKIVPGKSADSILWQKVSATSDRMPPVSLKPDPVALEVLKPWIDSLSQ